MDGQATPAQIGGFLIALRAKGETVDELVGAATAMRARGAARCAAARARDRYLRHRRRRRGHGQRLDAGRDPDRGVPAASVAKHGNRALSSRCGSADVLEALGVASTPRPRWSTRCMRGRGIGFAFAPRFHAATRHAAGAAQASSAPARSSTCSGRSPTRRGSRHQVVGVYDRALVRAGGARRSERSALRRAAVVHGAGGLDEIAVRGETHVAMWDDGRRLRDVAADAGAASASTSSIRPGSPAATPRHNATILRRCSPATDRPRRALEAVLRAAAMTAALGLELLEPSVSLGGCPTQYARAARRRRTGAARLVLHRWAEVSQRRSTPTSGLARCIPAAEFSGEPSDASSTTSSRPSATSSRRPRERPARRSSAAARAMPVRRAAFGAALARPAGAPCACIAEIKRASPSAGPIRPGADPGGHRARVRRRRRGRDLACSPTARSSTATSRTSRVRATRVRAAAPAQGLHHRPLPGRRGARGRRRRGPADRRGASPTRELGRAVAGRRRARARRAGRGPRRGARPSARWRPARRWSASTTAICARSRST